MSAARPSGRAIRLARVTPATAAPASPAPSGNSRFRRIRAVALFTSVSGLVRTTARPRRAGLPSTRTVEPRSSPVADSALPDSSTSCCAVSSTGAAGPLTTPEASSTAIWTPLAPARRCSPSYSSVDSAGTRLSNVARPGHRDG
ncbi:hypothetical protein [Streptomyces nodosus]|uniref:hypothetical protein n=1 Tax=Streptomyces nodosus TaxID=40318 RepID=UPI0036E82B43